MQFSNNSLKYIHLPSLIGWWNGLVSSYLPELFLLLLVSLQPINLAHGGPYSTYRTYYPAVSQVDNSQLHTWIHNKEEQGVLLYGVLCTGCIDFSLVLHTLPYLA